MVLIRGLAAAVLCTAAWASSSVAASTSDWPCVQRRVPTLEAGQMWSGPELGPPPLERSPELRSLVTGLTDPSQPMEQAQAAIERYVAAQPAEARQQALLDLFAATLETINANRGRSIKGIQRYAERQRKLAQKIADETRQLDQARRDAASSSPEQVADFEQAQQWDTRVFSDRQRSLRLLCDQPVTLEQRAFALARLIQGQLP